MDPFETIHRHFDPSSAAYRILVTHSVLVAGKARRIADRLLGHRPDRKIDLDFIAEAALLHDIGISACDAPGIACHGSEPYIRHGVIGRELLEKAGLPRHALVCERHTGAGITREEVVRGGLPLPVRDFLPLSLEEKIICAADKFFSKDPDKLWREKPLAKIARRLAKWGPAVGERWRALVDELELAEERAGEER